MYLFAHTYRMHVFKPHTYQLTDFRNSIISNRCK